MAKRAIAVVGSRTYPLEKDVFEALDDEGKEEAATEGRKHVEAFMKQLEGGPMLTIVSGGAKGPDTWAMEWAAAFSDFKLIEIKPNWKKYGNGAGYKRNKEIVEIAHDVVAFWDLHSNGTFHTLKLAAEYKRPLMIFGPDGKLFFYATEEDYDKPTDLTKQLEVGNIEYD